MVDAVRCDGFWGPESPTTWAAIKKAEWGSEEDGSRGVIKARCAWVFGDWAALGWLGTASGRRPGESQNEKKRAVEEGVLREKEKPGTVNTPTDALRNVSWRATRGRERQERGRERRWAVTTGTGMGRGIGEERSENRDNL